MENNGVTIQKIPLDNFIDVEQYRLATFEYMNTIINLG